MLIKKGRSEKKNKIDTSKIRVLLIFIIDD